ncbi:uncharacterized protein PV07_04726 [Cladophialophora immunda]|uniref:Type I restriction enzyme R protein N-terminal domain-containing protein n=1 Tax=Cladophialophora immunda TaxID=569365 RepID=A0A0D2CCQ6_9EURO|nr:uncharacterized protein PV07_04726 [Cladophialophora immunda]KIW28863.1 hypothetical protein PV07_04726 [Cladophialophora immunda]
MSLLMSPDGTFRAVLFELWKAAHTKDAQEPESLSFWQHLLSKYEFKEDFWICDAEIRPTADSRRRIDRGIRFIEPNAREIVVLCWLEAKGVDTAEATRQSEAQALDACKLTLDNHPWQGHVYALTTTRTKAKAWMYERGDEYMIPLHEEDYIEAHSSEGIKLRSAFERMKLITPAPVLGMDRSIAHLPATGSGVADPTSMPNSMFPQHGA